MFYTHTKQLSKYYSVYLIFNGLEIRRDENSFQPE